MNEVAAFPLKRRATLVLETADLIRRKRPDAATRFWHMSIRRLRAELQTYGIPEPEIDRQLSDFASAVLSLHSREVEVHGGDAA